MKRRYGDSGQVAVEFLGMTPIIIVTLVLVWQFVLVGYTFTLAGHAADEAVRAGTASEGQAACEEAGLKDLPGAWQGDAEVNCTADGTYVTAEVSLKVPVLFPGAIGFPFTVEGHAGAVQEEKD
ncbi:MAG: pilus assembly protein [Streptomyces sp.]|nr:pilus assembly protein [Streptomyces sp.]NUR44109.1 pilus assembly protein [Streptomyces sp.]NUR67240.1 pilus assembly protein [Streptomyces sp.]NUS29008.1 pilus assembly protein [Streptomyces sp.]NUS78067.1 pilus assembly protein [Streptomyces sp.]